MSENIQKKVAATDDSPEVNVALAAAKDAQGGYTHKFKKPFKHENKEYSVLYFDFEGLTGNDMMAIEQELTITKGISVMVPSMSGPFLVAMAARAAGIGQDILLAMPIYEVNRIRAKARSFLLNSEF